MALASGVRDLADQLGELAEEGRARFALPGLALGIAEGGELVGFGSAGSIGPDPEAGPPPGPRTAWRVASITKTLTATGIFQLRNHGQLGLDDRLEAHLPEFAFAPARGGSREGVTIRRMLLHQSGLPTETPLPTWGAPEFPTIDQIVDAFDSTEISIEPGTAFKYSNLAYGLLGEVIARRSDRPYPEYVQSHIFGPLEMHDSGFEREDGDIAARMAASWVPGLPLGGPPRPAPYNRLSGISSAGQLITTADDLARWLGAQRPGHGVVPDATLAEMQAPVDLASAPDTTRTLGWECRTHRGELLHGHGGGVYGFSSYVGYHVATGLGLIVLTNIWPARGAAARIALELFDRALGGDGVPITAGWTPPADDPLVAPTLAEKPFVGRWFAEPAFPVVILARQSGLHLEPSDGGEYALHAPSRLQPVGPEAEPRRLLALDGRPAGEYLVFSSGSSAAGAFDRFELGGFEYRRD